MAEKRTTHRDRVLKTGTIVFNSDSSVSDCTVRDLTETGAKLRLASSAIQIPDRFDLILVGSATKRRCVVVWRGMYELGVVFEALK
jgi:hypothetical protein